MTTSRIEDTQGWKPKTESFPEIKHKHDNPVASFE